MENCGDIRIECIPGCSGCGPLLKAIRAEESPLDEDASQDVLTAMGTDSPHESKSMQIFLIIHNTLNKKMARECARAMREEWIRAIHENLEGYGGRV